MVDGGNQSNTKKSFTSMVRPKRAEEDSESSSGSGGFTKKFVKKEKSKIEPSGEKKNFSEAPSVVRKSKELTKQSYADFTRKSRLDCVFLVRGQDRGRDAWHYVLVHKHLKEMFLAKSRTGSIDVAEYGEVLYSGWGKDPSPEIVKKIEDEFGV